jgi:pectin methylesterase-like acyl-CoA thioesterase
MRHIPRSSGLLFILMMLATARGADVLSMFPSPGATGVCPDTSLKIVLPASIRLGSAGKIHVFDASNNAEVERIDLTAPPPASAPPPAPGGRPTTGRDVARMPPDRAAPPRVKSIGALTNYHYYPVIVAGDTAEIFPAPGALTYGKTYYVTIDPGFFRDGEKDITPALAPTSWRFTTKPAAPALGAARITVASDSTGDFASVQGALDFIPANNSTPVSIFVKKGVYTEMIYFTNKHNITLVGEDRKQTVIQYATNDRFNNSAGGGGYRRGVLRANRCNDFMLTNLTIRNTTPKGGSQAETIILDGTPTAHAIVKEVDLYSFQDTLQINGQAYVANCYIEGDVDFMWGSGPCFFESCQLRTVNSNAYFTQIRNTAQTHGYVYHQCTFEGLPGVIGNVISRIDPARFPNSVVLIDCTMDSSVSPAAWRFDSNSGGPDVHFWEFNSHGPDGTPVDITRRFAASRQLRQPEDAELIKNYSDPAWVLGGWNPRK